MLTSRIDAVKVYAAGATVTRIATCEIDTSALPEYLEMAGLPLALDDSSVRARVEVDAGSAPIVADIRIGLAVPPRAEAPQLELDKEIRAASAQVQKIQQAIALINREIALLSGLQVPDRPDGEEGKAPPPSPTAARLALAHFSDEQVRQRLTERRAETEKLRAAQEHWQDLQQKQAAASNARDARPDELRKTAIARLGYPESGLAASSLRLVLEYFVPGARWLPAYVCRLNSASSTATIAMRALICQRTGEDWTGVSLQLSTAEPMAWRTLPELTSLRIGRAQPAPLRQTGWRQPPAGAELLFADFDRQQPDALDQISLQALPLDIAAPQVEPLSELPKPSVAREPLELYLLDVDDRSSQVASYEGLEDFGSFEGFEEFREKSQYQAIKSQIERAATPPAPAPGQARLPQFAAKRARKAAAELADEEEYMPEPEEPPATKALELAYNTLRLGDASNLQERGKLVIERQTEIYLQILQRQQVQVQGDISQALQQAIANAESCRYLSLPPGSRNVRQEAGAFDYAYNTDGRVDVPADGNFHAIAVTSQSTSASARYVAVPREDANVFRIVQLRNPLAAPLLAGTADVYVDGEYVLSTNIATVPPQAEMELGLGVEQGIKVARNTFYEEARSGNIIVAFNELRHRIQIDIANMLPREIRIEARERLPVPQEGAKVEVQIDRVVPEWEKYDQQERGAPIQGGYRWQLTIPAQEQASLFVQYSIKTFADSEVIGGNRREV